MDALIQELMPSARLSCNIAPTDDSNDAVIEPILASAIEYVGKAINLELTIETISARAKRAVLVIVEIQFNPDADKQGNLYNHYISLINQERWEHGTQNPLDTI